MEYIVLGLLIFRDMTIYQLNNAFKQGLSLIYAASYGNLQHAVKKLLKDNLISFTEAVENGRNKKIYRINAAGRESFFKWMESEIPINKLETAMLSRIYFLGFIDSKEQKLNILNAALEKVSEAMAGLEEMNRQTAEIVIPAELAGIARYQLKTLDYGLMSHSAGKNWLVKLIKDVEEE